MTRLVLLFIFIFFFNISAAQVFEISYNEYFPYMFYMAALDIGNNYIDDLVLEKLDNHEVIDLDPDDIPFFDRWVPNKPDKDLKDLSNYSYMALLGTGLVLTFEDQFTTSNYLILGKILLTQSAVGKWVKTVTARKRPYVWNSDPTKKLYKNQHSFYSLHSSGAFAIATYAYYHYTRENGKNLLLVGALYGGAALTGALRIASAQHFFSDVLAGAVVGSLISYMICQHHLNDDLNFYISSKELGINYNF